MLRPREEFRVHPKVYGGPLIGIKQVSDIISFGSKKITLTELEGKRGNVQRAETMVAWTAEVAVFVIHLQVRVGFLSD